MAGTVLVVLGLVFFVGQFFALEGSLFLVGLGGALLAAYALGRRLLGFLIAGCVLLAIGVFAGIDELALLPETIAGPLFFLMLGAAFVAVYVIHSRFSASWGGRNWALITGLALWAFATFVFLVENTALLSPTAWDLLGRFWPLVLIAIGLWQLFRRLQDARS